MTAITVVTANIRSNPVQRYMFVRARIKQALSLAGRDGVTFLQECEPTHRTTSPFKRNRRSYATIARNQARAQGKTVFGGETEIPIVLDTDVWQVNSHRRIDVHPGLAHISPDRDIIVVWATHKSSGIQAVFLNCHPVSKGHYPASRRGISRLDWRRSMLARYMDALTEVTERAHNAGRTVFYGGDLNDPTPARVHPEQHALNNAGLDHLFAVPAAGIQVTNITRSRRPATTAMDHPILAARVTLTGKAVR